jgi:glucose-6-phosphate isomerase
MSISQSVFFSERYKDTAVNIGDISDIVSLDCFNIVKNTDDLKVFENPRLKKWMKYRNFVVFGTGGASLGGQSVCAAFPGKNIKFINNLDPSSIKKEFEKINYDETGFLCISKSGETLETVCQVLLALKLTEKKDDKFVFITEDKPSSLKEIAEHFDFLCLDHPKTVGGRFSVFSIVGMLPALLCGIDPEKIRYGGRKVLEEHLCDVKCGAAFVIQNFIDGITGHVSFIYSDKLKIFGEWLAQLYAESTGKSGAGITPITSMGSVDQHSQLQLYLDGPRNKCFSFFYEKQESDFFLSDNFPLSFSFLKGKSIANVFESQFLGTLSSFSDKKIPAREIKIPAITPEILGGLFMHFMLEVVLVCRAMNVNPFDQPAVEYGKILTNSLLKDQC